MSAVFTVWMTLKSNLSKSGWISWMQGWLHFWSLSSWEFVFLVSCFFSESESVIQGVSPKVNLNWRSLTSPDQTVLLVWLDSFWYQKGCSEFFKYSPIMTRLSVSLSSQPNYRPLALSASCVLFLNLRMSSLNILGSPSHGISLEPNHDLSTSCELLSLWVGLPYIILSFLQCALLHPTFAHSKLSKLIRMSLMPINFIWWFTLPFRYCLIPSKSISQSRLVLAMGAFYLSIRTLEWGLATSAYYKRPLKTIDGLQRWEKVKEMDEWSKKIQEDERCDGLKLLSWTILQVSS